MRLLYTHQKYKKTSHVAKRSAEIVISGMRCHHASMNDFLFTVRAKCSIDVFKKQFIHVFCPCLRSFRATFWTFIPHGLIRIFLFRSFTSSMMLSFHFIPLLSCSFTHLADHQSRYPSVRGCPIALARGIGHFGHALSSCVNNDKIMACLYPQILVYVLLQDVFYNHPIFPNMTYLIRVNIKKNKFFHIQTY